VGERAEIVVVGAGIMGAATAYALARAGHEAVVLEQFELGHARGSSHGEARIFRLVYDDPHWVAQAQRALPLWRELEAETGETVLTTTGSLDVGPGTEKRVAALSACGVEFDVLDGADLRPPLRIEPGTPALAQRDGGVLNAARAQRAFLRGLSVRERARVARIDDDGRVHLDGETIEAQAVVVTAGAWVSRLLEPLGISPPVTPTRESVAYFPVAARNGLPTIIDWRLPEGYELPRPGDSVYALPSPDGLKVGVHRTGPPTDPDDEGTVEPEAVRCAGDWVAEHVDGAAPEPLRTETCLYTNMPDQSFVVERHGRVIVGSPCSGHGFKFAPLVGRELAALALEVLQ
jgi:sarcosine oxidase